MDDGVKKLKEVTVLFVPGFAACLYKIPFSPTRGYFQSQMKILEKSEIEYRLLPVKSFGTCLQNGRIISDAIEASSKSVILVSHSKGALDVIESFRILGKAHEKVCGWLAYQSTFGGSHVADFFATGWRRVICRALLRFMGENPAALDEQTTWVRANRLVESESQCREITQNRRVLSIETFKTPPSTHRFPWSLFGNESSDGVNTLSMQRLPGAKSILMENTDHAELCMAVHQGKPTGDKVFLERLATMML